MNLYLMLIVAVMFSISVLVTTSITVLGWIRLTSKKACCGLAIIYIEIETFDVGLYESIYILKGEKTPYWLLNRIEVQTIKIVIFQLPQFIIWGQELNTLFDVCS